MKKQASFIIALFTGIITFFFLYSGNKISNLKFIEKEELSGAMQAFDYWVKQRAYPENDIPADSYYREYVKASHNLQKASILSQWEEMGPHNIGGRTISLAINPLNPLCIYAGSASGGLWVSYSGGVGVNAWSYIPTNYPVLSVGAIVLNPIDTNVIYIGTGEVYGYQNAIGGLSIRTTRGSYGIGILKSTDHGVSWMKSLDWSYNQKRGVQVIKMDPSNSNILYAGTTEGIFKTTDAGLTWDPIHNVIMTTDILINRSNSNVLLAACGNLSSEGRGIYKSTDGGGTWTLTSNAFPSFNGKILLADFRADSSVCWASVGLGTETGSGTRLYRSSDFGSTWQLKNSTSDYATYQGWYSHFVIPHSTNAQNLLFGGIDMWKSTNGGSSINIKSSWSAWYFGVPPVGGPEGPSNYSHADHHCYAINPQNPNMVYFGTDGGVFRTTDFGETFAGCNGHYQTTQFYKRFGVSKTDTLRALGGLQDNATAVWEGTDAWRRVLGGDGCCTQISPTSSDSMIGSYQYLSMAISVNKGVSWSYNGPNSSNEAFNAPFLIAPNNSKIVYAGGSKIHKSTNFGLSWSAGTLLNGDPSLSLAVSYTSPDTVYATTAPGTNRSGVFRSTNGGVSFINITGTLPDRYPVDMSVDPKNSSIVYIVLSGFGTSHLFRSTNGGDSWDDIGSGLPDVPTSAIAIDPLNTSILYVGNDLGLFYSINSGQNWINASGGIDGTLMIMDLEISPLNRKLIVATHGRGVYRVPLASITVNNSEVNNQPSDFKLYQNYPNPFNGNTVIKYTIPQEGKVMLTLYDITGRKIKTLVDEYKATGIYSYNLNRDTFNQLSSGVYFYKLSFGKHSDTKKLLIMK